MPKKYNALFTSIIAAALFAAMPAFVSAADLFLSPASGSFAPGKTFSIAVTVNSGGGVGINAADGTVTYDRSLLSVTSVTRTGSIFSLWTEEPADAGGQIRFGGGNPSAYKGVAGNVFTITFRANTAGTASVSFTGATVLAADGRGTNVLAKSTGGTYTIQEGAISTPPPAGEVPPPPPSSVSGGPVPDAPKLASPTHPDENRWYSSKDPKITWDNPAGITAVAANIDDKPDTVPQKVFGVIKEWEIKNQPDGIWNVHVQLKNSSGWGKTAHRKIHIDSNPPEEFTVLVRQTNASDAEPSLVFKTTDSLSGLAKYEIVIADSAPIELRPEEVGDTGYKLAALESGRHSILVRAVDEAGNVREAAADIAVTAPIRVVELRGVPWWIFIFVVLLLLAVIGWLLWRMREIKKEFEKKKDNIRTEFIPLREKTKKIFAALRREVAEKIALADKKPAISEGEQFALDQIKQAIDISEELISKEFEDVEKELK